MPKDIEKKSGKHAEKDLGLVNPKRSEPFGCLQGKIQNYASTIRMGRVVSHWRRDTHGIGMHESGRRSSHDEGSNWWEIFDSRHQTNLQVSLNQKESVG